MELTLLKDCPLNTELASPDGQVVYRVRTPFRFTKRTTTITRVQKDYGSTSSTEQSDTDSLSSSELAQIHWKCFRSSILSYNGVETPMNEYLHRKGFFCCGHRTFTAADGISYKWITGGAGALLSLRLELDDDSKTVVARFHKCNLGIFGKKRKASLEIFPAGKHIVDQIVITFLYMDKLRRDRQQRARSGGG